jgi:thiamine pyrophosphate-dependent acetolactate synthase large subunit-like protein
VPGASASGQALGNGLANLHNARKAQSPMVNIIGSHATTHQRFDAPLTSDVAAFANTVSHWVVSSRGPETVAADTGRAVQAARTAPGQIAVGLFKFRRIKHLVVAAITKLVVHRALPFMSGF